jgi:hypothetical protein
LLEGHAERRQKLLHGFYSPLIVEIDGSKKVWELL